MRDKPLTGGSFTDGVLAYVENVTKHAAVGAIMGGLTSVALGGDFSYGAKQGAMTSAIAYTTNCGMSEVAGRFRQAQERKVAQEMQKSLEMQTEVSPTEQLSQVNPHKEFQPVSYSRGSPYHVNFRSPFTSATIGGVVMRPIITKVYGLYIGGVITIVTGSPKLGVFVTELVDFGLSPRHPLPTRMPGIDIPLDPEPVY